MSIKLVPPAPYKHDTFTLESHEFRIIEQGRTDTSDSTSLYVPSIELVVAGDMISNECHMYVDDTEANKSWLTFGFPRG